MAFLSPPPPPPRARIAFLWIANTDAKRVFRGMGEGTGKYLYHIPYITYWRALPEVDLTTWKGVALDLHKHKEPHSKNASEGFFWL